MEIQELKNVGRTLLSAAFDFSFFWFWVRGLVTSQTNSNSGGQECPPHVKFIFLSSFPSTPAAAG
jgi:hypothetical protein